MDGWHLGCATAPADVLGTPLKVTANDVPHMNPLIQHGSEPEWFFTVVPWRRATAIECSPERTVLRR